MSLYKSVSELRIKFVIAMISVVNSLFEWGELKGEKSLNQGMCGLFYGFVGTSWWL